MHTAAASSTATTIKMIHIKALKVKVMFQHIQKLLSSETTLLAETGDSRLNFQKLKFPRGCG